MRSKLGLGIWIIGIFAACYAIRILFAPAGEGGTDEPAAHGRPSLFFERIVSMSPSVTEILFALGLGDRVKGVTDFCDYPAEALEKNRIGGYFNPNYEAIVGLEPDLVILLEEHQEPRKYLGAFDVEILVVNHQHIDGILDSITAIGRVCNARDRAASLTEEIAQRIEAVKEKTRDLPRPKTMISVDRPLGTGAVKEVYVAGQEGFYDPMIQWAGGVNAYQGKAVKFPLLSPEGILSLNPDVIIDISAETETRDLDADVILADWNSIPHIEAVKQGRIYIFGENYAGIPGPRFVLILERIAKALHPEVEWPEKEWPEVEMKDLK
jgi:iron complex transport system substrate-binding protein